MPFAATFNYFSIINSETHTNENQQLQPTATACVHEIQKYSE